MERVKYSLFDFFGFALPGAFLIFSTVIAYRSDITLLSDLLIPFEEIGFGTSIASIVAAYLVGYATHNLGFWLHTHVGLRRWQVPQQYLTSKLSPEEMTALIREHSPRNADILSLWNALRAMSHNLSLGFVVLAFSCIYKTFIGSEDVWAWIMLAVLSMTFAVQTLKRAYFYHVWYFRDRQATVEALQLDQKK